MTRDALKSLHGSVAQGSLTTWTIETQPFMFSLGLAKCIPKGYTDWELWCDFGSDFIRFSIKYNGGKVHEDSMKVKPPESDSDALELIADHVVPLVEHQIKLHYDRFAESHAFSYGDDRVTPEAVEVVQSALPGFDVTIKSDGDVNLNGTAPGVYFRWVAGRERRGEKQTRYNGEYISAMLNPEGSIIVQAAIKHDGEHWTTSYGLRIGGREVMHHVPLISPPKFDLVEQAAREVKRWYDEKVKPHLVEVYNVQLESSFFDYGDPRPDAETWRQVVAALTPLGYTFDDGSGTVPFPWRFYKRWGEFVLSDRNPGRYSSIRTILNINIAPLREGWHAVSRGRIDGLGAYEMSSRWASIKDWGLTAESMDEVLSSLKRWDDGVAMRLRELEPRMD